MGLHARWLKPTAREDRYTGFVISLWVTMGYFRDSHFPLTEVNGTR